MRPCVITLVLAALIAAGLVQSAPASPNGLVISELRFRGPAGANDEFVELLNTSSAPLDVSGVKLQGCTSTSGVASARATIPDGTTLAPGEHYLLAHTGFGGSVTPDQSYSTGIADAGGARVVAAAGAAIDGAGSSVPATSECREGTGLTLPTADSETSFERKADGSQDSDDNASDFASRISDPQNRGGVAPPPRRPCSALAVARHGDETFALSVRRDADGLVGSQTSSGGALPGTFQSAGTVLLLDRPETLQISHDRLVVQGSGTLGNVRVGFTATLHLSGRIELHVAGRGTVFSGPGWIVSDCLPG